MSDSTSNRAARRNSVRRVKTAAVAGTAVAAMGFGMVGAPSAQAALTINWNPTYTSGLLAGVLNFVGNAIPGLSVGSPAAGYNSGPPQQINAAVENVPVVGTAFLNLFLKYLNNSSEAGLYNQIANIPTGTSCTLSATTCRYALMLATSEATPNLVEAYRDQIQSVTTGNTPAGLIPFTAAPNATTAKPTQTDQALILLQNPFRPNGGLNARFPDVSKLFGINPDMPAAGKYTSPDGKIALVTSTVDATWAYDPIGDFPSVFNVTSIANSLSALLPLNLVTGGLEGFVLSDGAGNTVTTTDLGLNLAVLLQMAGSLSGLLGTPTGKAFYATIVPNQLPLLAPIRLPGIGVNAVLSALNSPYLLGNPFADAIEPALRILVNIGYTDVVTPSEGGTYNRTFLTGGVPTPFGSVEPLTPEEKKAVPGDVWNALVDGVKAQFAKPFWGILVPNGSGAQSGATTPAAAAVKAAAAAPAPQVVAPEPVSAPQPAAPAAPVAAPADAPSAPALPAADPAPAVQVSLPAADPAPSVDLSAVAGEPAPAAPRVGARRGGASSSENSDAPKAAASTGRHRGAN